MRITQICPITLARSEIKKIVLASRLRASACVLTTAISMVLVTGALFAGSATWNLNPTNGFWEIASNWTPATVPNGPNDTATFGVSNISDLLFSGYQDEVNGIVFDAGASPFTITVAPVGISFNSILTISGVGITNNSGITQHFVTDVGTEDLGVIQFTNSSTAGDLTVFTNNNSGSTEFFDSSSAGSGTFNNNGGTFFTFSAGQTDFFDAATADNATLIANGSAVSFELGGTILFEGDSTGGTARVEVFAGNPDNPNGNLDISAHNAPGVTVGSIEGSGDVFLGANNLTVGSNNLSTTFSGVIQDGGSVTKIGIGTLRLSGANTYTGGTLIQRGALLVNNKSGSGTGSGTVQVNGGTLGGQGKIAGAVTVGTGSGRGAVLAPGLAGAGTLAIQSTLTFNPDAIYRYELNSRTASADKIVANGVTINGAQFSLTGLGKALMPGEVFTVINNRAATLIAGTFSNLQDGSIFTVNGYNFLVNYEGGDGNDLTLTVLP
ncbi:MAG: hypothetical protein DMF26_20630 [Verrucomicrobia bacterium]|nr:MAG: hypothetical protein DMF26_20630 [Verrucomicrobiota bacterium]